MSILKTNQIQTLGGKPIVNSTGSILQVVNSNTVGLTGEDITTSSSTPVSTGISASIIPISASSKLLVMFVGNGKFNTGTGENGAVFRIYRDGGLINTANGGDTLIYRSDAAAANHHYSISITHYVNANTTNSTTFTLFFWAGWEGAAFLSKSWGTNHMTIMEVSG